MVDFVELGFRVPTGDLQRADTALDDIAASGERAARSVKSMGAAGDTSASGLRSSAAAATAFGTSARSAGGHTANLTAQLNDIGVMLAAGQSPMMLAVQQGSQINQVFAQMGGGAQALRGIGAAAMSMVNPMSLATLGVIAGGAALTQWAMSALDAGRGAGTLEDHLERLDTVMSNLDSVTDILTSSTADLYAEYGEAAGRVRFFSEALAQIRVAEAEDALRAQVGLLRDVSRQYTDNFVGAQSVRLGIDQIRREFDLATPAAAQFQRALDQAANGATFEDQQAGLRALLGVVEDTGMSLQDFPAPIRAALAAMIEYSNAADAAAASADRAAEATDGISDAAVRAYEAYQNTRAEAEQVNRTAQLFGTGIWQRLINGDGDVPGSDLVPHQRPLFERVGGVGSKYDQCNESASTILDLNPASEAKVTCGCTDGDRSCNFFDNVYDNTSCGAHIFCVITSGGGLMLSKLYACAFVRLTPPDGVCAVSRAGDVRVLRQRHVPVLGRGGGQQRRCASGHDVSRPHLDCHDGSVWSDSGRDQQLWYGVEHVKCVCFRSK